MNPAKKQSNQDKTGQTDLDGELFKLADELFDLVDAKTLKRIIVDGHIANLTETINFNTSKGIEIGNLAYINHALIEFVQNLNEVYDKIKKRSQMGATAEI